MNETSRVLLVEDNPGDVWLIRNALASEPGREFELECAGRLSEALEQLERSAFDAVVVDLGLPDSQGLETFTRLHRRAPAVATLILTGNNDLELAMRAVQSGAQDFLVKGEVTPVLLVRAIRYARERARGQADLVRAKAEWELTFDAVPDLIAILDREYRFVRVNRAMAERLGRSAEECVGLSCFSSVHGTEAPLPACPNRLLLDDWQEHAVEIQEGRLGGDFLVTVSPLRGASGDLIGCVHVARDVTMRRRAEAEVRRLNAELEERVRLRTAELEAANRNLESFSYSVSHDLRAPLRAIDGFARMLGDAVEERLDPEVTHFLEVIRGNAQRMAQLIDDLLEFSRVGRRKLSGSRLDMTALVREVWAELAAGDLGPPVELRLAELPEAEADPAMLRQVWMNLLSNAVKFSSRRELRLIEVGARATPGETEYFVRDNGAGFDMRYAEKLFGVFQRLHASSEFEGTGVGLAIVRQIIGRHGGRVWAIGEPGVGATFSFSLPVRAAGD